MKKISYLFILMVWLTACNNEQPVHDAVEVNQPSPSGEASLQVTLQQTTPLTAVALKEAFPQQLHDLKLDKDPVLNGQTISGHFGGRAISLGITDAAGENYRSATWFLDALNDESLVDRGETKYIKKERDGIPTLAKYYVGSHTELEFLYKDRFYINLVSELEPDALWDAFDLDALKKL